MKSYIRRSATPLGAVITAFFLLVIVMVSLVVGRANAIDTSASSQNGRLLTIHDGDSQKAILTKADTIGDALKEAGIAVDKNDAVEPTLSEKLVASEYNVNIYRARPVVVIDGLMKNKIITPYQSAKQIAASAGITLYDGDTTTLTRSDDIISDGAGLILTINRATPFTFTLYGKTNEVRTQTKTVGEMLVEKGLTIGSSDRIEPSLDTPITTGMSIRLWREGKQTVTIEEGINFDTQQVQDGDQYVGYKEIQTPGQAGSRSVTYEVTIQDGQEAGRVEIASLVTKEPVKQVELIGVKNPPVPYTGSGTKTEWLIMSGIPQSDWGYADYIISHESGWNPNSVNISSGACGLAQALPCSKVTGNPLDPVDSLRWANSYAQTCVSYRMYCGWAGAYNFWVDNHWW